ncbi:MAG: hypothetical protein ACE5GW_10030, partial [Planctomycetota bacterium]
MGSLRALLLTLCVAPLPTFAAGQEGEPAGAPAATAPAPAAPAATATEEAPRKRFRGWPLLYIEDHPDGRREIDALYPFFHRSRGPLGGSLRLAPFYWSGYRTEPEESWSLLLPFYYLRESEQRIDLRTLALRLSRGKGGEFLGLAMPYPLALYEGRWAEEFASQRLGIPGILDLFHLHREGLGREVDILSLFRAGPWDRPFLPIFRYHRDLLGHTREISLLPLASRRWHPDESPPRAELTVPPLGWWRTVRGSTTHDRWLPLLGDLERAAGEYRWRALLGLWGGGSWEGKSWLRLEPFMERSRAAGRGSFSILHLYGRRWDEERSLVAHRFLDPLILFERSPEHDKRRIFPFYFQGRSGDRSYLAIAPLYYRERTPESSRDLLLPIYYSATSEKKGLRIAFPIFWKSWSEEGSSLHILPLYSRLEDRRRTLDLLLGPLYVRRTTTGAAPERSHSLLWPLFEHRRGEGSWHLHLLPSLWLTHGPEGGFDLVAPLYLRAFNSEGSHHYLLPFWGRSEIARRGGGRSTRTFYAGASVIHSRVTGAEGRPVRDSWHFLGPLAGFSRDHEAPGRHSRLLPLWWHDRTPEGSLTILAPLYFRRTRGTGEARSSLTLAGGNLWVDWSRRGERRERGVLWPLTRRADRGSERRLEVLGLFGHERDEEEWGLRLTPFFSLGRGERPGGVPPWLHLYSHQSKGGRSRSLLMPFLFEREVEGRDRRWEVLAGIAGASRRGDRQSERVLPFYYHSRAGDPPEPREEVRLVFPVYYRASRDHGDRRHLSLLFPLYLRSDRRAGDRREHNILWPLISFGGGEGLRRGRLFPLASYHLEEEGERRWALTGLWSSRRAAPGEEVDG